MIHNTDFLMNAVKQTYINKQSVHHLSKMGSFLFWLEILVTIFNGSIAVTSFETNRLLNGRPT